VVFKKVKSGNHGGGGGKRGEGRRWKHAMVVVAGVSVWLA
jgi:hypothetical protein